MLKNPRSLMKAQAKSLQDKIRIDCAINGFTKNRERRELAIGLGRYIIGNRQPVLSTKPFQIALMSSSILALFAVFQSQSLLEALIWAGFSAGAAIYLGPAAAFMAGSGVTKRDLGVTAGDDLDKELSLLEALQLTEEDDEEEPVAA